MSTSPGNTEKHEHINNTNAAVEGIQIIENRNLMLIFWILVSCSGLFGLIRYWPSNVQYCVSLSVQFGPASCSIFQFTMYIIEPLIYMVLLISLLFVNFNVASEADDPIEIKIENQMDEEIQLKLKDRQSTRRLFHIMPIYDEDNDSLELSKSNDEMKTNDTDENEIHDEYLWELIKEKTSKCEELLFPICILKALIIVEVFLVLYVADLWFIVQIFRDFCGYLLWLFYTAIITKLKFEHKVEHSRTKVLNYVFLCIGMIAICIMAYTILLKDLGFGELRKNGVPTLGFVQIILESTLVLELISIVAENVLHIYCTCFHHSYHPINDAPDISHLLGHNKAIFSFILFGLSQIILGTFKALQDDANNVCSNFTLWLDDTISDCNGYFWIIQLVINIVCLGILMSELTCNCHILNVELLVFPFIIGMLMMLCELCFALQSGNKFYFIQIFIDLAGYLVMFMQGLYALRFFMYINVHSSWIALKRGSDNNIRYMVGSIHTSLNIKLLLIFMGLLLCLIAAITTLILNFYTDVAKIETSAGYLTYVNSQNEEYQISVEKWMFLQIVFENTLIVEYFRILARSFDIKHMLHTD